VSTQQSTVKKYIVTLSAEEREHLQTTIRSGKHSARKLLRARILLKADVSEAGDGWTEEGVEGVLTPKRSPNSARQRIFDGASEAKLIALACSTPPEGRTRWTLQMLEDQVVALKIVARASDNTIGRTLKKTSSDRI
jgi:hypothetical protein